MLNGGEVVVETMLSRGVDQVYFVAGGTYVTILEALSRHQREIRAVPTRLEQSAVFAAEVWGAIQRRPACVFVSRAPGAARTAEAGTGGAERAGAGARGAAAASA